MLPYTYLIGWSKLNIWYYGCRYSKNCHPSDLWKTYFTSSSLVKEIRIWHGEPDVVQIIETFTAKEKCLYWEETVIRRLGAVQSSKWLNRQNAGKEFKSPEHQSKEHRDKRINAITGVCSDKKRIVSTNNAKKATLKNIGKKRPDHSQFMKENHPMKNPETIEKVRIALTGKKKSSEHIQNVKASIPNRPRASCILCHKPKIPGEIYPGMWMCHIINHHNHGYNL